jgi:hypothetical protein
MINRRLKYKNILVFEATEKLTDKDSQRFANEVETLLSEFSKLKLMIVFKNFKGRELRALWDDLVFDTKHYNDFEKIALVVENSWEYGMFIVYKAFSAADVKSFNTPEISQAMKWLLERAKVGPEFIVTPY